MRFCSHWKLPQITLKMRKLASTDLSVWLWDMNSIQALMRYILMRSSDCVVSCMSSVPCEKYLSDKAFWTFQGIIQLEKELAYLGSVCAAALMKKDLALPIGIKS